MQREYATSERSRLAGLLGRAVFALRHVLLLHLIVVVLTLLALCMDPWFFLRDDGLSHCVAGFREIVRLCGDGTFPLITERSWCSGALAAEYQFGVFSPVQMALVLAVFSWDIPFQYGAAAFFCAYALILATGSYVLARSYRVSPPLATMVALTATLNGWIVIWGINWLPATAAFAWVPWVWWSMHRLSQSTRKLPWTVLVGLMVALTVLAGFPFTVLMVLLLGGWLAGHAVLSQRKLRACLPILLGIGLGLALSAPAWAMLVEYKPTTIRPSLDQGSTFTFFLSVPPAAYLGTILPSISMHWARFAFVDLPPAEMHVGVAPVVLLAAALLGFPRRVLSAVKPELLLLGLLTVLCMAPSLSSFRWMFRWLPMCFLVLGLTAARAAEFMRQEENSPASDRHARPIERALLAVLGIQALLLIVQGGTWYARAGVPFLLVTIAWYLVERCRRSLPKAVVEAMPATVIVVSSVAFYWILPIHSYTGRDWQLPESIAHTGPFDPSRTYLAVSAPSDHRQEGPIAHFGFGNAHLYAGLKAVNGYSPLQPRGLYGTFGFDAWSAIASRRDTLLVSGASPGPLLRRMGVDGLVVTEAMASEIKDLPLEEFVEVAKLEGATLYHRRTGKSPCVHGVVRAAVSRIGHLAADAPGEIPTLELAENLPLSGDPSTTGDTAGLPHIVEFGEATIRVIEERADRVVVEIDASDARRHVLVSFARAWYPGYQASLDGVPVACGRLDCMMPAVVLPPGSQGKLTLVYRPNSLQVGLIIAALAAGCAAMALLASGVRNACMPKGSP